MKPEIKKDRPFDEMDEVPSKRKRTDLMPVEEEMVEIPPKSKRERTEPMIKKEDPSFEVCSQSAEKVMLATEQHLENHTMLLEILSRLPVKSLLRFMWACKHWKTLILSDSFRKLHREKHISSPPLPITCYNSENVVQDPIELMKNPPRNSDPTYNYLITFDVDGKILGKVTLPFPDIFSYPRLPYQSKLMLFVGGDELISFYLYNPSTRQTFQLTGPPCLTSPEVDHRDSDLGYIPSKDEYIMVHLVKLSSGILACEVLNFSISNDNFRLHYKPWRSINATTELSSYIVMSHSGVFVGGAFYWEASSDKKIDYSIILSFDVETESFSTFGKPEDLLSIENSLLQLKDELYLANYPRSPAILVLWKFSSDNKLWTRHWEFDLGRLFGLRGGALNDQNYFNWQIFLYTLKYIKGYDHQPCDEELSDDMGLLLLDDGRDVMPLWHVEAHTNFFTL